MESSSLFFRYCSSTSTLSCAHLSASSSDITSPHESVTPDAPAAATNFDRTLWQAVRLKSSTQSSSSSRSLRS
jgi:hypothetical protein